MLTYLLKSALPFTMTFIIGAALGGFFFNPFGVRTKVSRMMRTESRSYGYEGRGCKHRRFRQRELVAESKPLVILFKPDARLPNGLKAEGDSVLAKVMFGADGKIGEVSHVGVWYGPLGRFSRLPLVWAAIERAARQIQFEPETINGLPVSVTKEIEIRFMAD